MRQLSVIIETREGTQDIRFEADNASFNSGSNNISNLQLGSNNNEDVSDFDFSDWYVLSASINSSLTQSDIRSEVILISATPANSKNMFQSGQPVYITDSQDKIFQGVIVSAIYSWEVIDGNSVQLCKLYLGTWLYQLTMQPLLFSQDDNDLIKLLLGIDTTSILAGNVTQSISLSDLTKAIFSNTDFLKYALVKDWIIDEDLQVNLMFTTNQPRDSILRQSIEFTNKMFYQSEDGIPTIKTLNYGDSDTVWFSVDAKNQYLSQQGSSATGTSYSYLSNYGVFRPALLDLTMIDNIYSTPAISMNYGFITPDISNNLPSQYYTVAASINKDKYTRMGQLVSGNSWFIGDTAYTQLSKNIVSNPSLSAFFQGKSFIANQDYIKVSTNITDPSISPITQYQQLLTYRDLAEKLSRMFIVRPTVCLDDPAFLLPDGNSKVIGNLIGKVMQVDNINTDFQKMIVSTTNRTYNSNGLATLSMELVPLGSFGGYTEINSFQAPLNSDI